jgi:hypothetical protein
MSRLKNEEIIKSKRKKGKFGEKVDNNRIRRLAHRSAGVNVLEGGRESGSDDTAARHCRFRTSLVFFNFSFPTFCLNFQFSVFLVIFSNFSNFPNLFGFPVFFFLAFFLTNDPQQPPKTPFSSNYLTVTGFIFTTIGPYWTALSPGDDISD